PGSSSGRRSSSGGFSSERVDGDGGGRHRRGNSARNRQSPSEGGGYVSFDSDTGGAVWKYDGAQGPGLGSFAGSENDERRDGRRMDSSSFSSGQGRGRGRGGRDSNGRYGGANRRDG
ncbi:unnamed protein product, partial [Sphacelaria rigidula]